MISWWWAVAAAAALVGLYVRQLAGRLDRLHVRVDAARDALDAQLVRRAAAALELAHSGLLDPASSVLLAEEAYSAQTADEEHRAVAESELTTALHAALPDAETVGLLERTAGGAELVGSLRVACGRVVLAHHFYDEAVRSTQGLRHRRLVRLLRLAGSAPYPQVFDVDDQMPVALGAAA